MIENDPVKDIVKANASAVYKDSLQPSVRVVGNSLAQCISLFVTPIGRMAQILEGNIHRYLDKLEGLDEEEIVPPDTRVLVPILEKMRFIDDEKVAEYYAEILAKASTKENHKKVMITFIEILNRLSSDELVILEYIASDENRTPLLNITDREVELYEIEKDATNANITNSFPVLDLLILDKKHKSSYQTVQENFNCLDERINLSNPDNIYQYIHNMVSLGLIKRKYGVNYSLRSIYNYLKEHEAVENLKKELAESRYLEFEEGKFDITEMGKKLISLGARAPNK